MSAFTMLSADEIRMQQATFISKVYAWMSLALLVTGLTAVFVASTPALLELIFGTRLVFYGLLIGEFLLVAYLSAAISRMSAFTATAAFIIYACLNGLTLAVVFLAFTAESIASTFFITAGTFAIMSAYGYFTKRDLTSVGNLAMMGLVGIILASIVNFFFQSEVTSYIITYIGILVFVALTAYDTQKIKQMAIQPSVSVDGTQSVETMELEKKGAIMGALSLYLDFINLFLFLLRLFGRRR